MVLQLCQHIDLVRMPRVLWIVTIRLHHAYETKAVVAELNRRPTTVQETLKVSLFISFLIAVVLEPLSQATCWKHQGFSTPAVSPFLADGMHFNLSGQYALYRSYRGAILYVLRML